MPKVNLELKSNITIISARTKYEHLYPKNYQKWKVEAFMETRKDMDEQAITNLITKQAGDALGQAGSEAVRMVNPCT